MSVGEAVIQINDLRHTYLKGTPLQVEALKGVTMEVRRGESLGIIGRAGSGKSTTVQHFNGLIRPRQPGKVVVFGQDMSDPTFNVRQIRLKVGLVFQYPEAQLFERLVGDDVAFGPFKMGLALPEVKERVRWAMDMVGLPFEKFADRFTFSLSGGEARKAAIAGVLALRPEVLVLDESTSGVDPRGRKDLLADIRRFHDQEGLTIVFISSNMEDLASLVDRVYVLEDGRTVLEGSTAEVFAQTERLHAAGLGTPQITQVMHLLRQRGLAVDDRIVDVAKAEEEIWKTLSS
ncbi:MAG: energy-coupling factor transporter ATPase [Chloroflexi bacterium]|nr:energy-coupling factor transporter ATPase [Chloroflexota bacterium]MCL5109079.1 energy-coupling factor transporter ATPase [Chloroflexota bacterium]